MREPHEWPQTHLGAGVRLLLGWRTGRHGIEARPVSLATNVAEEMVGACRATLARLGANERRPYSGVPALEPHEYLSLPLTAEQAENEEALTEAAALLGEEAAAASQLIQLLRGAFDLDNFLSRAELQAGRWLFYAVVVEVEGNENPLAFVRQYNPQRGIRPGRLLLAYHDTLSRFDDPLFNFDLEFDLVIAPDEIAVLSTTAFERVFADVGVLAAHVPDQVVALANALGVSFAPGAAPFLETTCLERATLARRLRRVAQAAHLAAVTQQSLGDALERHGLPRDRFGGGLEVDLQTLDDIGVFIDMLEQLYFEADFTGEHRRADRYSTRG